MENMVSIPESRYIELLEIEKKYKADNFNNDTDNDKRLSQESRDKKEYQSPHPPPLLCHPSA